MGRIDILVSAEFAAWEQRGRGWHVWPECVRPEPAFTEFTGYKLAASEPIVDDGRRPTFLASMFDSIQQALQPKPPPVSEDNVEPEAESSERRLNVEFIASLPARIDIADDTLRSFLKSLDGCHDPVGFEFVGNAKQISVHFVSSGRDAFTLQRQLTAFFPELTFIQNEESVANCWHGADGIGFIVDFGLAHEFMLPLQTDHRVDPFVALVAALSELRGDEIAVFQVLFQPVQNAWAASAWRSVSSNEGKALFINRPHIITGTKTKLESPLFGVVVRVAAKANDFHRAAAIIRDVAVALGAFERMESNRLIPLTNDEYPFDAHEEDLLNRQSRRSGMLLNRDEVLGFVHFPSDEVRSLALQRQRTKTRSAPQTVLSATGLLLGVNQHAGRSQEVRLNPEQRVRHVHVIGASGKGKSTLLFNLIQQDIANGEGLAVLDPHGDLITKILGIIPPERIDDVVLVDPSDEEYSVGFNILSAHSDFEKNLLASDLVSVFRRLSSSWGDQLNSVLSNAILAFLESSRGGTLADVRRFLLDAEFRNEFLGTVRDPDIVYYWRKGFPQLGGNKSIGPVITRLDTFLGPKPIRYMMSQRDNRLDFANILDTGKIFLAKLPQGQMGKENAFLLGSLLVTKLQQMAMSRQRMSAEQRRDFFVYLDEFQNFITPSMAEVLNGARKYRIGLILAHQELHQLQRDSDVASAVLSNAQTRIVFNVGDADAATLAKGFTTFEAKDLQNLETGAAICRIERSDYDFNLRVPLPEDPSPFAAAAIRNQVVTASREKYATPRAEVEAALFRAEPDSTRASTEIRKVTGSETPQPRAIETVPSSPIPPIVTAPPVRRVEETAPFAVREPPATRDLGRGGAQHQAIQRRIKKVAEEVGFKSTIEKEVLDGKGGVDLLLERSDHTVACEISITTTIDHEVGNVVKCLKAGFSNVAVICLDERHREKIRSAVSGSLGTEVATRVSYYHPDQFIAHLETLRLPVSKTTETAKMRRGFRVIRTSSKLAPEEQKQRENAAIRSIAEAMQRKTK